jgi:hypothetical protein
VVTRELLEAYVTKGILPPEAVAGWRLAAR